MSIDEMLKWKMRDGALHPLIPKASGTSPKRAMLLAEDVWTLLRTVHDDPVMEERLGYLQADLEAFADGQPIHPKYLFLLSPIRDAT